MSREERTGKLPGRDSDRTVRQTYLGYYLIVTDTKATEKCYFDGLYQSLPQDIQKHLCIRVVPNIKTQSLIEKCCELIRDNPQVRIGWIVFDRDRVPDFDRIISDAENSGLHVGWSNPCFEIWMYAYFEKMPVISESKKCCFNFGELFKKKTSYNYSKSDSRIYRLLNEKGDEKLALKIAHQRYEQLSAENKKCSEMYSCTTVFKLVQEIRDAVK